MDWVCVKDYPEEAHRQCDCRQCTIDRVDKWLAEEDTPEQQAKVAALFSAVVSAVYGVDD